MNLFSQHTDIQPSLVIPKPLIYLSKFIQFFSTRLVTFFCAKLFITPIKFATPKRELAMQKSAQKKKLFVPSINKNIHVLSYGYSKKKVLLVHGWAGRSTQLYAFANALLENGYMAVAFDGPAHGKSDGKTALMPEFLETIKEIETTFGPFDAAIGHSFGGFCLTNSVANHLHLKSLITIGASDLVSDVLANFTRSLALKPSVSKKLKASFDKKWGADVALFSSRYQAEKINIPTLVIHDSKDGDVAVSCALHIRQNLKKGTLLITKGLGHTKILRDKEVIHRVIQFIKQHQ